MTDEERAEEVADKLHCDWFALDEGIMIIAQALLAAKGEEREKVAKWMIERNYTTGHGDTIEELLQELDGQIRERKE